MGIVSHVSPDGDGFASSLALQEILRAKGINAEIIVDAGDFSRYDYLEGSQRSIFYDPQMGYRTLIILDCNSASRLGERRELIHRAQHVLVIDHHEHENGIIPNVYQHISTAEVCVGTILYKAFQRDFKNLNEKSRKYIAECLYTSIINDTNNFTNINTNREVLRIASELCHLGLDPVWIHNSYFSDYEPQKLKLITEVLSTLDQHHQNRIVTIYSTLQMLNRYAQPIEALDDMTKWVQGLKGVDAIIYLKEMEPKVFKVSLRSPLADVNRIAVAYGGGGHKSASGLTIRGDQSYVMELMVKEMADALDRCCR